MAKSCVMCGGMIGFFSNKAQLKDGLVCEECLESAGLDYCDDFGKFTAKQIVSVIQERVALEKRFQTTNKFGRIRLDLNLHAFKLDGVCYPFSKLISYSFREDPENQRIVQGDGKSAGTIVGGIVGGLGGGFIGRAVGATVGAAIGNKVGGMLSSTCNYMYISITLQDAVNREDKLYFIREKTKVSSEKYRNAAKAARDCMEALEIIARFNAEQRSLDARQVQNECEKNVLEVEKKTVFVQKEHLPAEEVNRELTTYMTMLKSGLITEEEYNAKKKQLLSLM